MRRTAFVILKERTFVEFQDLLRSTRCTIDSFWILQSAIVCGGLRAFFPQRSTAAGLVEGLLCHIEFGLDLLNRVA
jgi:hypothetical protein